MATRERLFPLQCLVLILLCIRGSLTSQTDNAEFNNGGPNKEGMEACTHAVYPRDCQEVYERFDGTCDGVYLIKPYGYPEPFEVFCNNTFDSGGWTVFQRRMDGGVKFYRNWNSYKNGFGLNHRNFWLGNEKIYYLTNQRDYELRIDLVSTSGTSSFGHYDLFRIGDESTHYTLLELGSYQGNIGSVPGFDYMDTHRGESFSTVDADHDSHGSRHCARDLHGGWWYNYCYYSNLNGDYYSQSSNGICLWDDVNGLKCGIRYTEMKIRPKTS